MGQYHGSECCGERMREMRKREKMKKREEGKRKKEKGHFSLFKIFFGRNLSGKHLIWPFVFNRKTLPKTYILI